jgi:cystathionine beta-lyase/cystathionine gamma-synthase
MDQEQKLRAASRCVHAGYRARGDGSAEERAVAPPLSRSSTFLLDDDIYGRILDGRWSEDYLYTRYRNPTLDVAARRLASLEGAERSLLFASGLAALHAAVLGSVPAGGRIVAARQLYGGSWDMLRAGFGELGFEVLFADVTAPDSFARALEEAGAAAADLFVCESASNPILALADIPALAEAAHGVGARLLVDATFATPLGQRPLELGADLVMHSASKYLGGHSDLIGGAVSGSEAMTDGVWTWLRRAGGCMDPGGAWPPTANGPRPWRSSWPGIPRWPPCTTRAWPATRSTAWESASWTCPGACSPLRWWAAMGRPWPSCGV